MAKSKDLKTIHSNARTEFNDIQSAVSDERQQNLDDRRFYSVAGAMWEGPLGDSFEKRPKLEVNKIHLSVIRIINEYRNNRVTVDFMKKDDSEKELADTCNGIYRADEQDSNADEAYDNAFEEAVGGGIGAWRFRACYEDEYDGDNDHQRIRIEPIFDADTSVFFDLGAKRQDKADAKFCFVINSMTPAAFKDTYDDDPASWDKDINSSEFDWSTDDAVYVAEYYKVEEVNKKIFIFEDIEGKEERHHEDEFTNDPELRDQIEAEGATEIRVRTIKEKKVRKYLMSGAKILEDCGYIAGKNIPIVPIYGKRWVVDNVERSMGHVRLAKDAQRLKNMQLSKLAEIAALSSVEKPIFHPEQINNHKNMWANDNIKDYPYLVIDPMTSSDGENIPAGPIGYTKPAVVPPATGALLQVTEQDMQDILGNQQAGDEIRSNISGKAVEMVQTRLDMQTFIYMSNFAKGMQRGGEIWLSMAKEVYVENERKLKIMDESGSLDMVEIMKPSANEAGEMIIENDITKATFDVVSEVGPSSSSKKAATVRALTGMMQVTTDPEDLKILSAMNMMNMEGEGISGVNEYYRKKLVRMGVNEPTKSDIEEMQAEQQNQPEDTNALYLKAEAEKSTAQAEQSRAKTVETMESAKLKEAQTMETLAGIERDDLSAANEFLSDVNQVTAPPANSERVN